jgi:hypothetical protein
MSGEIWCAGGQDCVLPTDKKHFRLTKSQKLCMGDSCFGVNEFRNMGKGGGSARAGAASGPILNVKGHIDTPLVKVGAHNINHPDDVDGAVYRADGQLQIATDDLVRVRHIGSKQTGIQFDARPGAGDINNPNGQMKITRQGIMFGGPNADREVNSGQISAGLHIPNSLNIVGMSKDKGSASRRVDVWAEGGHHVHGWQHTSGHISTGGDIHMGGDNQIMGNRSNKNKWIYHHPQDDRKQVWIAPHNGKDWDWGRAFNLHQNGHVHVAKSLNVGAYGDHGLHGWTGANFRRRDGRWTHFDWVGDQQNYLRGNTVSDGMISMQDHQLRLRGMGDGNHYVGWSGAVDGPRIQGHQGGMLATNLGGDKTVASWSHKGTFKVHDRLLLGDKWSMSGTGDGHANDDWLRLMNTNGSNYHGGFAAGRLWTAAGALSGSDATMKTNIQDIRKDESSVVHQLRPRKFQWKGDPSGKPVYGFVAQEVKSVLPQTVSAGANGKLAMDYQQVIPLLVTEIQDLKQQVENLKK